MSDQLRYDIVASLQRHAVDALDFIERITKLHGPPTEDDTDRMLLWFARCPQIIDLAKVGLELNEAISESYKKSAADLREKAALFDDDIKTARNFFNTLMRIGGADQIKGEFHQVSLVEQKPKLTIKQGVEKTVEYLATSPWLFESRG